MGGVRRRESCTWGHSCWGSWGGRGAHPGPGCFPLCLQSSGNVWVTHEEMETLATSTKTVSLALGPSTSDTMRLSEEYGKPEGLEETCIPDAGPLCSQRGGLQERKMRLGIIAVYLGGSVPGVRRPLAALGWFCPVMALSHKLPVLGLVLGAGGKNGSVWHLGHPQASLGTTEVRFCHTNLLPSPRTCMYVPAFSAVPTSLSWFPVSYRGVFSPLLGAWVEAPGFLTSVSSLTCGTVSC